MSEMKTYEEHIDEIFESFSVKQSKFIEKFNLESYSKWFYDQESELLRLYNSKEDEIFFKYIPIGTYSQKAETWMWSWANKHTLESSKHKTLVVQSHGNEKGFVELTNEIVECEEEYCWSFVAITANLIENLGVYKTNSEELSSFKLLISLATESDQKAINKLKQKTVNCGIHGYRRPAFVCQHLNQETPRRFEEAFETIKGMDLEEEDDFAAWCNQCEEIRIKHDGWTEESEKFAKIKLVCEECYFELKNFNLSTHSG